MTSDRPLFSKFDSKHVFRHLSLDVRLHILQKDLVVLYRRHISFVRNLPGLSTRLIKLDLNLLIKRKNRWTHYLEKSNLFNGLLFFHQKNSVSVAILRVLNVRLTCI